MARIVDKPAKKLEILKAAMGVFAQVGVVNTRMAQIAEAAGVGKGTIYEYFRSKEDIFAEAYRLVFEGTEEKVSAILQSDLAPEEKLRQLMTTTAEDFLGEGGEFARIIMDFWSEGIRNKDERITEIIDLKRIYAEYRLMIAGILEDGVRDGVFRVENVSMSASVLIGAMDGVILQWILDPTVFDPENAVGVLLDCYLNGIRKPDARIERAD